jgi:hypothetical protein
MYEATQFICHPNTTAPAVEPAASAPLIGAPKMLDRSFRVGPFIILFFRQENWLRFASIQNIQFRVLYRSIIIQTTLEWRALNLITKRFIQLQCHSPFSWKIPQYISHNLEYSSPKKHFRTWSQERIVLMFFLWLLFLMIIGDQCGQLLVCMRFITSSAKIGQFNYT